MSENNSNNTSVSIMRYDAMYCKCIRPKLIDAEAKLNDGRDNEITSSGMMLVSDEIGHSEYLMSVVTFGKDEAIIHTLTHTLIQKLKEFAPQDESVEEYLSSYITFFIENLTEGFYGSVNPEENED